MNDLIETFDKLLKSTAYTFTNDPILLQDLYQVGVIGLLNAKKNYDEKSNAKFSSYAYKYIYGEMYHYIYKNNDIKLSPNCIKLYKLISKAKTLLSQELKREVTIKDISKYINVEEEKIINCIEMMQKTLSIEYEYENENMSNFIKSTNDFNDEMIDIFTPLSDKEKELIKMHYFDGYTQKEIANHYNTSQVKISRIEDKIIQKVRNFIV